MTYSLDIDKKKVLGVLLVLVSSLILMASSVSCDIKGKEPPRKLASFDECVAAGNPVMESYPRQCRTADGDLFVEDIGNVLEKLDLIRVSAPRPNGVIGSPLIITGEARGVWFFEGVFPIVLLDGNGEVAGKALAWAQSEWMTGDFVPFLGEVEFKRPTTAKGILLLKKDNPSGLPEHDDELRVPISFTNIPR